MDSINKLKHPLLRPFFLWHVPFKFYKVLSRWLKPTCVTKELRELHVDSNAQSLYRKYCLLAVHCFEEDTDSLSISIYTTTFFDVVWHKQILTYRQLFFFYETWNKCKVQTVYNYFQKCTYTAKCTSYTYTVSYILSNVMCFVKLC